MLVSEILFIAFASMATLSGFKVITSKNPIHSVFFLVLAFVNTSILLILLGAEFLALVFMIVYVGAIAILFLFVVMLLNIRLVEILDNTTRYVPIGFIIAVLFFLEVFGMINKNWIQPPKSETINLDLEAINQTGLSGKLIEQTSISDWMGTASFDYSKIYSITNMEALGHLLYTEYFVYFMVGSLVLLVSMIGAILLTLSHESSVKRQDLFAQVATQWDKTIVLKKL